MDSVAGLPNGGSFEGVIRIEEEKMRSRADKLVRRRSSRRSTGLLEAEADEL
jgi:hypothetical protein